MDVAAESEDTGTLQALKALDSLESKINQVQVAYQQFYTTIGIESAWKFFLDETKNVITTLDNLPKLFGKIPVGAVTVIADIISLIKNAALNGLSEITKIWTDKMHQVEKTEPNTRPVGDKMVNGVVEGIKSRRQEIQQAFEQSIKDAYIKKADIKDTQLEGYTGNFDQIQKNFDSLNVFQQQEGSKGYKEYRQQLAALAAEMQQDGNIAEIYTEQLKRPSIAASELKQIIKDSIQTTQEQAQALRVSGESAVTFKDSITNAGQSLNEYVRNSKHLVSDMNGFASALNMVSSLMDTSTVFGQRAAGAMMTFSGAMRLGSVAAQAFQGTLSGIPWITIAMGIISIINGISTAIETAEERAERLSKVAEDLSNTAKQEKANYNTLQRSIDKLSELEKKRYDSAEAAEEYQTAVDELADKYPALITGLDELGNATIEAANLDYELEKARQASAEATLAAAKAEREAAKDKLETAQNTANDLFTSINKNLLDLQDINTSGGQLTINDNYFEIYKKLLKKGFDTSGAFEAVDGKFKVNPEGLLRNLFNFGQFEGLEQDQNGIIKVTSLEALKTSIQNYWKDVEGITDFINIFDEFASTDLTGETSSKVQDIKTAINNLKKFSDNKTAFNNEILRIQEQISENGLQRYFPKFIETSKQYTDQLTDINELIKQLESTEKTELSAAINTYGKTQQDFVSSLGEANNILVQWLYNQEKEYEKVENKDVNSYISDKLNIDYKQFADTFNSLFPNEQELFTEMFKNRSQYTAEDFVKTFGNKLEDNSVVFEAINSYYEDVLPDYVNLLKNKITKQFGLTNTTLPLYKVINSSKDIMSADLSSWTSDVIDLISDYSSKGLTNAASSVTTSLTDLINGLSSEDVSTRLDITSLIKQYGLSSVSALDSIIESLPNNVTDDVKNAFIDLKNSLVYNLPLAIQAYTNKLVSDAEDVQKSIKNISNGMSISEAIAALEKINAKYGENHTLSELKTDSKGNIFFDKDLREKYVDTIIDDLGKEKEAIDKRIRKIGESNKVEGELKLLKESFYKDSKETFNVSSYQDLVPTLQSLDLIETFTEEGIAKFRLKAEEFAKIAESENPVVVVLEMLVKQLDNAEQILQYTTVESRALEQLNTGSYKEYLKTLTGAKEVTTKQLKEIAQGGTFGTLDYKKLTDLREKLNSNYSSLISDALSNGFENIHLEDYDLIDDTIVTSSYKDFVKKYAKLAGKTVEETNKLIVQAIEKDTATTTGAAADAIKNITFVKKDLAYASLDTLQKLADAFGISIEKLYDATDYNTAIQGYKVKFNSLTKEQLENIANYSNSVADSVSDFLNSIIEAINKGIEGKLNFAERDNLIGQLKARGIDTITEADFTKTADGLKLSSDAATRLYQEISRIDALQGKLIFDDLRKSLEKTEVKFKNISKTSAEVVKLEKELAKEKAKTLDKDDKKIKKLEQELRLAKDIQLAQSQDGKSFDFMGRDLPSYLEGPKNYWDSVGSAYKAMNESAESGYMDVQDFYNIVEEMGNLMAMSGNTIQFMGQTIDSSAESTAKLIEAGLSTLSNIDGEGVKINLTKLSKTLLGGSKEMGKGFDEAVQEMARSQIKIIDGMISLLETVVAMEKLGTIDTSGDSLLDLGEMFDENYTKDGQVFFKATQNAQTAATQILDLAKTNEELNTNLNKISFNDKTLRTILEDLKKGANLSKEDAEVYTAALNSLYQMVLSGEYDLDNLMTSIQQIAAKTGFLGKIQIDDIEIAIGYGGVLTTNEKGEWEVPNVGTFSNYEDALKANALQLINATDIKEIDGGEFSGKIKVGNHPEIEVHTDGDKVKYHSDKTNKDYSSIDKLIEGEFQADNPEGKFTELELEEYKIKQGYKIVPEITSGNIELTQSQINNLVGTSYEELKTKFDNASKDEKIIFEATYGFKFTDDTTEEDLNKLKQAQGIENKKVELTLSTNTTDTKVDKILNALETATPLPVSVEIEVTLNDGKPISIEVTGIDTSTDNWSLKGIINGEAIELKNTEIAGLTLSSDGTKWLLNAIITGNNNEVNLGAAKFTNLRRENDKWILQGTITSSNGLSIPTVDIVKVTHNEDGSYTLESPFYGSMTLTATEFDGLLKGTSYTLPENVVANALINVKPGEGFDGNKPKIEEPDPVEVKVGVDETSYNETQQTLEKLSEDKTKTITVQYKNPDGTVIDSGAAAENFEGELEGSYRVTGLQNSTGNWSVQGIFSSLQEAIDSLKVSPETDQFIIEKIDATGAPIETTSSTITIGSATVQLPEEVEAPKKGEKTNSSNEEIKDFSSQIAEINNIVKDVTTSVEALKTTSQEITADKITEVKTASENISSENINTVKSTIDSITNEPLKRVKEAIDNISGSVDLGVNIDVSVSTTTANASAKGTINSIMSHGGGSVGRTGSSSAKWKQSYAYARGTLMGELGPELYVTNGHYFVAGQNGPEFIDLADDAIVFNHLQTKKLLEHGNAGSRGYAINGDKKATAFAAGTGPAMASATEALAALRQLRAMWQAMLNASAKELGSKAGTGKGSSGSGSKDAKAAKSYIADLERWYNLLRQIEKIERDISRQELLQTKYQNDRIANGDKIYQSYKEQLNLLEQQSQIEKTLATEQRAYYEQRAQDLRNSNFSKVFTFNNEGLMQYTSGAGKGLDLLSTLNATNEYGGAVFSPEEQVALLKRWGFGEDIKYDSSGNLIDETKEGSAESMVQAFWDKVDGWKDELDSLYDSVEEHENKTIELETQQNKIVQAIVDNQIELENKVLEAIENLRQSEIDALQDERDAFAETLNKLVDGLSEALEKERQMYENEDNRKDIQELQQQISILRRSGGSASQIASLQDQLDTKQREAYFAERQQEIDAIKEASDLQLEKMDQQIEIMTEALEYEKANGLLWDDVDRILQGESGSILDFINNNNKEFQSASIKQREDISAANLEKIQMFKEAQEDKFDGTKDSIIDATHTTTQDTISSIDDIDENIDDLKRVIQSSVVYPTSESSSSSSSSSGGSSSSGSSSSGGSKKKKQNSSSSSSSSSSGSNKITGAATRIGTTSSSSNIGRVSTTTQTTTTPQNYKTGQISGQAVSEDKKEKEEEEKKKKKEALDRKRFGTGGLATYTGWAWLDGTPSKPEYVLNAEQTDILRTALIGNQSSLSSLRSTASSGVNGISNSNTYNTTNNDGVNIENITLEMKVESIADDYGADRAGEAIMNKIVQIARKSGARSLSRR